MILLANQKFRLLTSKKDITTFFNTSNTVIVEHVLECHLNVRKTQLKELMVPIISHSTCTQPHIYGTSVVEETMFCAGYLEGGKDGCQVSGVFN